MCRIMKQRNFPGTPDIAPRPYEAGHAALARRAAAEGIVLLKNDGQLLPLERGSKIALYGAGASKTIKGGTGSGDVNERYSVTVYEGLKNAGYPITSEAWLREYEDVYQQARLIWKQEVLSKIGSEQDGGMEFFEAYATTPFYLPTGTAVTKTDADAAIYVLSRIAGEGADRMAGGGDYCLSGEEHQMLADICSLYEKVIVILNTGGVVDLSFLDEFSNISALLLVLQPGMEGGNAIADVISGDVVPSGKLTDTWAYRYEDYPNAANFSHNNGNTKQERYEEGIYVGYRYFDSFEVPARYGFGFGLSYTQFSVSAVDVRVGNDGLVTVSAEVRNLGTQFAGKEVVQVYVSLPEGELEKEYRRLCAFAKTRLLKPGECQTLELSFSAEDMASYDEGNSAWVLEPGVYGIFVGNSLEQSKLAASLKLEDRKTLIQAETICPPQEELELWSCPSDKRRARYETLLEMAKDHPVLSYDLSDIKTKVYDYTPEGKRQDEAEQLVEQLTTEQMIRLVTGDPSKGQGSTLGSAGVSVPGSAGETSTCALEQGIANIVLADGPAGLRLNQVYAVQDGQARMLPMEASMEHGLFFDAELEGTKYYQFCTAIPVGTLLAQTWDADLLEEIGRMIGEEMKLFGVTLWLAPGMNIHRNPLCGRNFEYYSEDPLLSGKIAAAITRGVQSRPGYGTTIKHFACNNQEDNRKDSDSILTERTLREIYLRGFGIAIRESNPMSIMSSYNLINGVHAANCYDLCTKAAWCEFGFDGLIMTDWTTTEQGDDCTAAGCVRAGNDLVMPGQFSDHESIRQALQDGTLTIDELRRCVIRIVRVILKSDLYQ